MMDFGKLVGTLHELVDDYGLETVLDGLGSMCVDKMEQNQVDRNANAAWEKASKLIDKTARSVPKEY